MSDYLGQSENSRPVLYRPLSLKDWVYSIPSSPNAHDTTPSYSLLRTFPTAPGLTAQGPNPKGRDGERWASFDPSDRLEVQVINLLSLF